MTHCTYRYSVEGTERTCPRSVIADHDRCVFYLSPAERREAEVSAAALRSALLADVDADDPYRREYVGIHLTELNLSALVVDGNDVSSLTFRQVTVDGTLDLSRSVVRHPIVVEDCCIDRMDVTQASFEMDVSVEGTTFGGSTAPSTCFRARRGSFDRSLELSDSRFEGGVEFAACRVREWLDFDGVTVVDEAHFPNLSFGTAQFVSTALETGAEFTGATGDTATFDRVRVHDGSLDLSEGSFGLLHVYPDGDLQCRLVEATVSAGRLDQPDDAVACYDLTDATVGDVDLDCGPDSFDRYRIYRTQFDEFPFASYREVLRANRWRLHEYVGHTESEGNVEGIEHTYLEAK